MTVEGERERGEVCLSITSCQWCSWRWSLLSWSAAWADPCGQDPLLPHFLFSPDLFSTLHCTTPRLQPSCIAVLPAPRGQHRTSAPGRPPTQTAPTQTVERRDLASTCGPSFVQHAPSRNWKQPPPPPRKGVVNVLRREEVLGTIRTTVTDSSRGTYAVARPRAWQHQAPHMPIPVVLSGPRL